MVGIDASREVVEQQDARVERERARQHEALLLAARQAAAALGDHRVESRRQRGDEVVELGGGDRPGEIGVGHGAAERDVLADAQVEDDAVLEDEPDLPVQRLLVVLRDQAAVVLDASGARPR